MLLPTTKRAFLFLFFLFLPSILVYADQLDHSAWDRLLHQFTRQGLVDYQNFLGERDKLEDYLKDLEEVSIEELSALSREERIAFWVNLYNASLIRMVLESYPIERINQIPAAFEIRTIRALNDFFSLTELRDEILRQGFRDERILTALVSGRMDSPRLLEEAYVGDHLEAQLNRAAHEFVEDEMRNQIRPGSKKIFLSPIFREFGKDFVLNFSSEGAAPGFNETETAVVSFLLHHLKNPEKRLFLDSSKYKIKYVPEDSKLNDIKNHGR
jgi:hypothetical protein